MDNLDRFNTYEDSSYEEPEEFSTCSNSDCRQQILVGDEYIEHYGSVCCNNLRCLIATTESMLKVAGEGD